MTPRIASALAKSCIEVLNKLDNKTLELISVPIAGNFNSYENSYNSNVKIVS